MNTIREFQGEHRFLSNFWPCVVVLDRIMYLSVEHAYQAAKTLDTDKRRAIRHCTTPGEARRLGRGLVLRPGWESLRLTIMESLLRQKFAAGTYLADRLIGTCNAEIQEGNRWGDTFWGVDLCTGRGDNHLGKLIMSIRADLLRGD